MNIYIALVLIFTSSLIIFILGLKWYIKNKDKSNNIIKTIYSGDIAMFIVFTIAIGLLTSVLSGITHYSVESSRDNINGAEIIKITNTKIYYRKDGEDNYIDIDKIGEFEFNLDGKIKINDNTVTNIK